MYLYPNTSSPLGPDLVHLKNVEHISGLQTLIIYVTLMTKSEIS